MLQSTRAQATRLASAVVYLVFCDGLQQGLSVRVDGETLARLGEGGDDFSIQALVLQECLQ